MKYSYQEAYNKIIDAYFKDEIKPMDVNFCFCGTLAERDYNWTEYFSCVKEKPLHNYYTTIEYDKMERALLDEIEFNDKCRMPNTDDPYRPWTPSETYEEDLFRGMCAALDVLKKIHLERGEDVQYSSPFVKRELACQS